MQGEPSVVKWSEEPAAAAAAASWVGQDVDGDGDCRRRDMRGRQRP